VRHFNEVDGYSSLLAGFRDIPKATSSWLSTDYWRGMDFLKPVSKRRKTPPKNREPIGSPRHQDEPAVRLELSLPVGQCTPQQ